MMRIDIISAVPQLLESPLQHSIVGNARTSGLVDIHIHDLRQYSEDKHKKVDDYPYGGGAGMVLTPQPLFTCVNHLKSQRDYDEVIFTAPDGLPFNQQAANQLSLKGNLIIICGHYKGVDQRVRNALVTCEYSIGDYVLSGGELPALVMVDAIVRLLPGALGDAESALTDSFQSHLLEGPIYTRPAEFDGMKVPEVLRSGDHQKVKEWRFQQSLEHTKRVRPDIYKKFRKEQ
jgi:tRNA (guanine37-N1)-methyltransferase